MVYRNKTYIAFDADTDMKYYNLMKAWRDNEKHEFNFHNAHDLNNLRDGSSEETIKRKLKERMNNTKLFICLVGENTKNLYKFVRWEIDNAIEMKIPIIVVNINGSRQKDNNLCPPILKDKLAIHISFKQKIILHAMGNWPQWHFEYIKDDKKTDSYYYKDEVYDNFEKQQS